MSAARSTIDLSHPPHGVWFRRDANGFELGATTRSRGAYLMVPFVIIWSAFILGVIYGSQIHARKFDLRLSLFGLPFLAFTVFFGMLTLLAVWGRVVISVNGDDGKLFTGVGSFGKTRKFQWGAIREIHKGTYLSPTQSRYPQVVLEGDSRISFGAGVQRGRLDFMFDALQLMLYERHQPPETS